MASLSCLSVLVLALTWGWSHQQYLANCNYELDVVFAIDGSNSMFRQNFEQEKQALANLVNSLNVSPRDINVGVVLFSSVVQSYPLSGDKAGLLKNISALHFPDEATRTDVAIRVAHGILDQGRGGAVRKMLVIITDGRSTNMANTLREANSAKQAGINIYAVGVTDAINDQELRQIASRPENVYHSQNFITLRQVLLSATNEACITVPPTLGPKAIIPECIQQLELIIALDGSNSMFQTNFEREKTAIANLITTLQPSQGGIHIGLVLFSGDVQSHPLSGNSQQLVTSLNNYQYPDDATRTDLAIDEASQMFRSARGGNVQRVLVIVTDGRATFPTRTLTAANNIKNAGVKVFAIGVTDAINQPELTAMASNPRNVLFTNNFQTLQNDLMQLAVTICEEVTLPPPTAPTACNFQLDMVIAFDGSNSMFENNFNIQKAAISNLVRNLNISPSDIRVGIVLFSGDVTSKDLSGNKMQIATDINNLQYPDDTTRTDLAIQETQRIFASSSRGGTVPKLLIIITDGRATFHDQTVQAATAAKNSGISITCVGVTDAINQQELQQMASSSRHVFLSADFQSMQRDIIQATNEACQYVTTVPPVTTRTICNDQLDMAIAIDGSNSMFQQNFDLMKSSVSNLVNNLNVSPRDIFVGLVLFSGDVTSRPLSGNKQQIMRDVNAFQYPDDQTRTDLAIEEANRLLAQSRGGNVRKLLLIITDGRATYHDRTLEAARAAKANGINIYVVGVTDAINQQELRDLASTQNNVFFSNNFQTLQNDLISATRRACYTIAV